MMPALTDHLKTRFCPSPTGLTHIGTARTALFSYLLAHCAEFKKAKKSEFLLRIEDTDKARSTSEFSMLLMEDLKWLDLDWNEGPYYQSERFDIYQAYYQQLLDQKKAYYCFCTEVELQISRRAMMQQGKPPRYLGTCRHLNEQQIQEKLDKGLVPAIRYHIGEEQAIEFCDLIQGAKSFQSHDIGDFIIKKNDGTASFMFCNALDDALMNVTHVIRGEDHLTNTPRQLLILQSLGLRTPLYGHMAMIVGDDGKPLSKRNGSLSIGELKAQGFLPIALLNYLSRLGHHFELVEKLLPLEELADHFALKQVSRSPARFDYQQLLHWQKEALSKMSDAQLREWMLGCSCHTPEFIQTIRGNIVTYQDVEFWSNQFFVEKLEYNAIPDTEKTFLLNAGAAYFEAAKHCIQEQGIDKNILFNHLKTQLNLKGPALFMPMRIAISGVSFGPEMDKIFALLGQAGLRSRLDQVLEFIGQHAK